MTSHVNDVSYYKSLVNLAHRALNETLEHTEADEEHRGGFLCILTPGMPAPDLVTWIGECPWHRAERRFRLSQEKATRLAAHPDHFSSWQSRNPDKDQWGGAIRTRGPIVSFSGLPEKADEAICLATAWRCGLIDTVTIDELVKVSDNEVYRSWEAGNLDPRTLASDDIDEIVRRARTSDMI